MPVVTFEEDDIVSGTRKLLRSSHARRSGPHDGDTPSRARRRRLGEKRGMPESIIGDGPLDRLDGHRFVANVQHARRLARRRADATGHFGKIVRREKATRRLVELSLVHEVVPLGNEIAEWTALMTEGNAAVHASRCLLAELPRRSLE